MNGYKQQTYLTFKGENINIIGLPESDKSDSIETSKLSEDSSSDDTFVSSKIIEESSSIETIESSSEISISINFESAETSESNDDLSSESIDETLSDKVSITIDELSSISEESSETTVENSEQTYESLSIETSDLIDDTTISETHSPTQIEASMESELLTPSMDENTNELEKSSFSQNYEDSSNLNIETDHETTTTVSDFSVPPEIIFEEPAN